MACSTSTGSASGRDSPATGSPRGGLRGPAGLRDLLVLGGQLRGVEAAELLAQRAQVGQIPRADPLDGLLDLRRRPLSWRAVAIVRDRLRVRHVGIDVGRAVGV